MILSNISAVSTIDWYFCYYHYSKWSNLSTVSTTAYHQCSKCSQLHCCHSLVVTVQSSVVRRLRKPGEGDMGDIGQPSKMFTLSMCTTVNRKTWGQPYTRVRWVSKFNFVKWYMGLCFWTQHISEIKMAMFDVVRVAQQIKRKQGICSEICSAVKLLLRRTSARIIWSIWHVHTGACILSPFRSCLAFGSSILCALRAISFVQ